VRQIDQGGSKRAKSMKSPLGAGMQNQQGGKSDVIWRSQINLNVREIDQGGGAMRPSMETPRGPSCNTKVMSYESMETPRGPSCNTNKVVKMMSYDDHRSIWPIEYTHD
jgi:hypothetical protein